MFDRIYLKCWNTFLNRKFGQTPSTNQDLVVKTNSTHMELQIPEAVTRYRGGVFVTYHKINNEMSASVTEMYQVPEEKSRLVLKDLEPDSSYMVCFAEQMDEEGRPLLNRCAKVRTEELKHKVWGRFGLIIFSTLIGVVCFVVVMAIFSIGLFWHKQRTEILEQ